jgi:hypothetical protein
MRDKYERYPGFGGKGSKEITESFQTARGCSNGDNWEGRGFPQVRQLGAAVSS